MRTVRWLSKVPFFYILIWQRKSLWCILIGIRNLKEAGTCIKNTRNCTLRDWLTSPKQCCEMWRQNICVHAPVSLSLSSLSLSLSLSLMAANILDPENQMAFGRIWSHLPYTMQDMLHSCKTYETGSDSFCCLLYKVSLFSSPDQSLRRPSVFRPSLHNFKHLLLWNHWAN